MNPSFTLRIAVAGLGLTAAATAQTVLSGNISTSQTLTVANSPYRLQGDVYVLPGATLTIQPGVRFESTANSTLAITRGAQIIAAGTQDAPITFTSSADTGVYRQNANNEWGNVTIMGSAYISEDEIPSNTAVPKASNYADMEGLTPATPSWNDYGGGNDNDDSGTLTYCNFRYGGVASIPGKELNGLSLGGIGRNTDIHHIEVLNNIDDGIEVWGGTVNLKYLSIWNIGDDSLDIDQGWRGKAQFGLIVQGASNTGDQGSGFGDNAMEIDGAERCDWQPVTTCAIHNFTVIGGTSTTSDPSNANPTDELVELRDNARVQFLNCIFMDAGKQVFNDKVTDGEANNNTTVCGPGSAVPQMATRMATPATSTFALNAFPGGAELTPAQAYTAQNASGHLVELRGCMFYNNNNATAYTQALSYGIFPQFPVAGTNHANNSIETTSPIFGVTRSTTGFSATGHSYYPVTFVDPRPAAGALTAAEFSPDDGFFTPARYVGGFARGNNWLIGWTGTSQYGLTTTSRANEPITGVERGGLNGVPVHYTTGSWAVGSSITLRCENLADLGGLSVGVLAFGASRIDFPIFGGIAVPNPDVVYLLTGSGGEVQFPTFTMPAGLSGVTFYTQFLGFDPAVPADEFTFSNAQAHRVP